MNGNQMKIMQALDAVENEINGKPVIFNNGTFRLMDDDNTIEGTCHIEIIENQYHLITRPSIGKFIVGIHLLPI